MAEEMNSAELNQVLMAFKALSKNVEKQLHIGIYEGTGDISVRSYQALHRKIKELLPDDFYITEVLTYEPVEGNDRQKLGAINILCGQMTDYLKELLRNHPSGDGGSFAFRGDADELKGLGRELQDQILSLTKNSIRRAISNIDIQVNSSREGRDVPQPPQPPQAPQPPQPPQPPTVVPPTPPNFSDEE